MQPKFEILRMPPENTNSVLVASGGDAVVFDPWGRADDWQTTLSSRNLQLRAIYATHAHPDHIAAAGDLAMCYDVPWHVAAADNDLIGWGGEILDYFGLPRIAAAAPAPRDIPDGVVEILPGVKMQVIPAPGHTPGGRMFYFPDFHILLTGDTLFRDGFGRYDFPGGNQAALFQSISNLYNMNLPADAYVVHGHGPDSTIEILRRENQYFRPLLNK